MSRNGIRKDISGFPIYERKYSDDMEVWICEVCLGEIQAYEKYHSGSLRKAHADCVERRDRRRALHDGQPGTVDDI